MNQKSKLGFYFHIPFCPHICPYCDFTKTSQFQKKDVDVYFKELLNQLEYFLSILNPNILENPAVKPRDEMLKPRDEMLKPRDDKENTTSENYKKHVTVYFGGGTPGLFNANFYRPLLNKLKEYYFLEEVTLETNPHTNYEKNFQDYRAVGFDRITLGAQSLCPNALKTLGRKHSARDVITNLEWAKKSGFENIQVDLIYGLKKEIRTLKVEEEIEILHSKGATGISAYFLTIEKRTLFANSDFIDEENGVEEYIRILNKCHALGLIQIETSNFSLYEAKHNNLYWYGLPYIGIGTGAHGLLPATMENPYGIRYKIGNNIKTNFPGNDILIYKDKENCKNNFQIVYEEARTKQEYIEECIFTFLRTPLGIDLSWLARLTEDSNLVQKILKNAKFERAFSEGKLHLKDNRFYLSAEEKIRGDAWALDFISAVKSS